MKKQLTKNSCGCACGQQLLDEEGICVFQSNLTKRWYRGHTPKSLAENLRRFSTGWRGGYLEGTRAELQVLAQHLPFIARLGGNPGHFVIVDKIHEETVFIRDPAVPSSYNMPVTEFLTLFSGAVWK